MTRRQENDLSEYDKTKDISESEFETEIEENAGRNKALETYRKLIEKKME